MIATVARSFARLTTTLIAAFDVAATARKLGFADADACVERRQGKCPGRYMCADCKGRPSERRATR